MMVFRNRLRKGVEKYEISFKGERKVRVSYKSGGKQQTAAYILMEFTFPARFAQ